MNLPTDETKYKPFKKKVESLEISLSTTAARIEDTQGFLKIALTVITIVFVAISVIVTLISWAAQSRASHEFDRIDRSRTELSSQFATLEDKLSAKIEATLGATEKQPSIELLGPQFKSLSGKTIETTLEIRHSTEKQRKDTQYPYYFAENGTYRYLRIRFALRNVGEAVLENFYGQLYMNEPIVPLSDHIRGLKGSDKNDFSYMTAISDRLRLPPGATTMYSVGIRVTNDFSISDPTAEYPVELVTSAGREEQFAATFMIRVAKTIEIRQPSYGEIEMGSHSDELTLKSKGGAVTD